MWAQRHDVDAIQQDLAAIHWRQSGNATQQGGLAATGRAEQGDELALVDFAVDIAEHGGAGVAFLQVLDADIAHSLLSLFKMLAIQVRTSTKKKYEITSALVKWPLLLRMLFRYTCRVS
ncbi:hypothetical protein D3C87_1065120 [compost metagenome]